MNKPVFKVVDEKGRVLIPRDLRLSLGIAGGDIIGLTEEKGRIVAKKAVVLADDSMPMEAKECYVQSVVREFDGKALSDLLELIARLIGDTNAKHQ